MKDLTERANREFRVAMTLQEVDRATGEVLVEVRESGRGLADTSTHDRDIAYASAIGCIKFITDPERAHALMGRFMAERETGAPT